jgi:hypothetical protein
VGAAALWEEATAMQRKMSAWLAGRYARVETLASLNSSIQNIWDVALCGLFIMTVSETNLASSFRSEVIGTLKLDEVYKFEILITSCPLPRGRDGN